MEILAAVIGAVLAIGGGFWGTWWGRKQQELEFKILQDIKDRKAYGVLRVIATEIPKIWVRAIPIENRYADLNQLLEFGQSLINETLNPPLIVDYLVMANRCRDLYLMPTGQRFDKSVEMNMAISDFKKKYPSIFPAQ